MAMPFGMTAPKRGQGCEIADGHVEGATGDLQRAPVARVDVDELDLVGVGMGAQGQHPGHHDALQTAADTGHPFDDQSEVGEHRGQLVGIAIDRGEVAEPGKGNEHQDS